jgi:hypothetical protein
MELNFSFFVIILLPARLFRGQISILFLIKISVFIKGTSKNVNPLADGLTFLVLPYLSLF